MVRLKEEVLRRPLYVFDLPPELLATLQLRDEAATGSSQHDQVNETRSSDAVLPGNSRAEVSNGSKACSRCNLSFSTIEDQRSHMRSDLHGYNLKQRLRGLQPVSEDDFEKIVDNLEESLSGSDSTGSDDDDEDVHRNDSILSTLLRKQAMISNKYAGDEVELPQNRRTRNAGKPPIIWFKATILDPNTYLGIYRAIFTDAEQASKSGILEILHKRQLNTIPAPNGSPGPHIFLCMIGGGHFAAMIVALTPRNMKVAGKVPLSREATVLAHKTFHRYTTRRKQGGSQSSNDSAKGPAHSVGSSLRRAMEVALTEEVRLLLLDWKAMIDSSQLLFVRATGATNRRTLFGPYEGQVLTQNDTRLRGFPFSTRRATQSELMRSFIELTRVKVKTADEPELINRPASTLSTPIKSVKSSAEVSAPKRSEAEETALLQTSQIQALIRRSKLPALLAYLVNNTIPSDFVFSPRETQQNRQTPTALHLAASLNNPALVNGLLIKAGANPEISNQDGRMPFDLASDRATRDAFRLSRSQLGEAAWDWNFAHVPSALTQMEVEVRTTQEKQEAEQKEVDRRNKETERLRQEGPKVADEVVLGRAAERGRARALGAMQKTAQEKREEESKGLTPEMRARLERERRARAAEERIKKMQG